MTASLMEERHHNHRLNAISTWSSADRLGVLGYFFWGACAFLVYEVALAAVLKYAGVSRNPTVFLVELLVFGLVASVLCVYSQVLQLRSEVAAASARNPAEDREIETARIEALLARRLAGLHHGVDQSLSAIMFFTRAQLGRAGSPQLQRDLREVMERIDQIRLLVLEMQRALGNLGQLQATESDELLANSGTQGGNSSTVPSTIGSLRKASRKAIVLPVTIRYVSGDAVLEFHSYTVNVCEGGACVLFASQDLENQSEIGLQILQESPLQARIRWVQPLRENSFRLAGIEFVGKKLAASSL